MFDSMFNIKVHHQYSMSMLTCVVCHWPCQCTAWVCQGPIKDHWPCRCTAWVCQAQTWVCPVREKLSCSLCLLCWSALNITKKNAVLLFYFLLAILLYYYYVILILFYYYMIIIFLSYCDFIIKVL